MAPNSRSRRLYDEAGGRPDQRSPYQIDRDRILYSSSFLRLDGITQIVRAGEADVFHNRLTHSIKVAQVGRRIAEHCLKEQPEASKLQGLDVEVVEAACLGHDLGHPPFGYIGEQTLNDILTNKPRLRGCLDPEGFEGNAQSFRVVTKLAVRFSHCDGLDLTRATLAALLKYPWKRDRSKKGMASGKDRKWGYYESEEKDFRFCREGLPDEKRTLEAELMDWADDIAYSVHDLEDFHRCNFIPWARIFGDSAPDQERIVGKTASVWHHGPSDAKHRLRDAHQRLSGLFGSSSPTILLGPYEGTRDQRLAIRSLTSELIGRYIKATKIAENNSSFEQELLKVEDGYRDEVRLLKQIARDYILASPSLAAQQQGQKRIVKRLFHDFLREIKEQKPRYLPPRFHHLVEDKDLRPARATADCIASLTEGEAIGLHQRLTGHQSGSVLDPIVR